MTEILTPLLAVVVDLGFVEERATLHEAKIGDGVRWHQLPSEEQKGT